MKSTREEKKYDVVISGMGPAGLATALELASEGKSILIISNRSDEFTRKRLIGLNDKVRSYIDSWAPDEKDRTEAEANFLALIDTKGSNVAIKDIEKYLKAQLDRLKSTEGNIHYMFDSELTEVDLAQGTAGIGPTKNNQEKTTDNVQFTYLIGADGVNRHALKLVQKTGQVPDLMEITHPDPKQVGTKHAIFNFIIQGKDGHPLKLSKKQSIYVDDTDGIKFGLFMKMSSFHKSEKTSVKVQATTAYPEEISHIVNHSERNEAIKSYILKRTTSLLDDIGLPPSEYEIKSISVGKITSQQPFTLFQTKSREASKAAVELNNHYLIAVGNNVYDPDYRVGEGLPNAVKDAHDVKKIVTNRISITTYNKKRREKAEQTRSKLDAGLKP